MTRSGPAGKDPTLSAPANTAASSPGPELEALYRREVSFVWRTLRYLGVPGPEIEDAAHEVFVVVQRRWDDLDAGRDPRPWLAGIARNVAMHERRRRARVARKLDALGQAPPPSSGPTPEAHVAQGEALEILERFLDTLPDAQREAFVLVELQGLRGREVAELLDEKRNTIASRVRLARAALQAYLHTHADAEAPR